MSTLYSKYGTPPDIDQKPEWEPMIETQKQLLQSLESHTKISQAVLFEDLQWAIYKIKGTDDQTMTLPEAHAIVESVANSDNQTRRSAYLN